VVVLAVWLNTLRLAFTERYLLMVKFVRYVYYLLGVDTVLNWVAVWGSLRVRTGEGLGLAQ
jgi:hypothetical protein